MTPKATSHVIQGMQKDTSKSKLGKEFAFDAKNIRITAREGNTLLTITNEKGTKDCHGLFGYYLGHCVLNNQLVLFTTIPDAEIDKDHIFLYDSEFNQTTLYSGNLNFSLDNPLETLGVYENEDIQKVYWVDGLNQPRVINIAAKNKIKEKWNNTSFDFIPELQLNETVDVEAISNSSMFAPGVIQYAFSYYNKYGQESNIFNTTPLCYLAFNNRGASPEEIIKDRAFKITVSNLDTNFEYVRIYSIHRTSFNAVPTVKRVIDLPIIIPTEEYITIKEQVPYYKVGNENKAYLKVKEGVHINSQIESYNGSLVSDVFTEKNTVGGVTTYRCPSIFTLKEAFNIVIGSSEKGEFTNIEKTIKINSLEGIEYVESIYKISEREIKYYEIKKDYSWDDPYFIVEYEEKTNTIPSITHIDNGTLGETIDPTQLLYIGGEDIIAGTITQKDNTLFLGNIKLNNISLNQSIKDSIQNNYNKLTTTKRYLQYNKDVDIYNDNIKTDNTSYFKSGELYRLGIQFQHKNGKWSEPVYIGDIEQSTDNKPEYTNYGIIDLPSFSYELSESIKSELSDLGFKKMRGLAVFPEEQERRIIAQGMLCPTLYNSENRENNNPYSQSSWFIRPNLPREISYNGKDSFSEINNRDINEGAVIEFRHGFPLIGSEGEADRGSEIQGIVDYKVDQSILNLYSPDIEFSNNTTTDSNVNMRIVGLINFTSNYGDIEIQTKSSPLSGSAKGVDTKKITSENSGSRSLISGVFYEDKTTKDNEGLRKYLIYPWHRSGSLNFDSSKEANSKERSQSAVLKNKKISNYKVSTFNTWFNKDNIWEALGGNSTSSFANGISEIKLVNTDYVSLTKLDIFKDEDSINYYGNIDDLVTSRDPYYIYSSSLFDGELEAITVGTGEEEANLESFDPVRIKYKSAPHYVFSLLPNIRKHIILPTINNINSRNGEASELNLVLYNPYSDYQKIDYKQSQNPEKINIDETWLKPDTTYGTDYYEIFKRGYNSWIRVTGSKDNKGRAYFINGTTIEIYVYVSGNINMWKYEKSHNSHYEYEENKESLISQDSIEIDVEYPYLFIAELYRNSNFISNAFGGQTEEAIKNNLWLPASQSVSINSNSIIYEYGDTRYQRYDCLKTYAFTPEDENQVVEIASFMCETRVNMLGRYDKNIGNLSNLNADPTNFNLFNPVYSQKDNFFNYRILDSDIYKLDKFTNTITWSKEKFAGEDVDTWTNITMASTLDLDGTKGKVNKLLTFKDQIFAFQDKGISNILFNSRVQIPVSDGVPIEISNGMKVEGSRYISDNIGCQNKNSIVTTPSGVYFLDSESNGIYLLADGLTNLSTNKGFDIWTKEVSKDPSFKSFYDKNEKDIYFTTEKYCLGYSEKLGQFTSFYDYTDVETMFNIGTGFYSIKADNVGDQSIYQHSVGNYNEFYGEIKPYHLTIISNEDPQVDKVFTNLDYRADFFDSNNNYLENESFDTLEVWNEYQRGKETLKYSKFRPSNLKKKFRMWGANIPRDKKNKLDRMRNPWLYIKLSKETPGTSKMELHDIVVKYFE